MEKQYDAFAPRKLALKKYFFLLFFLSMLLNCLGKEESERMHSTSTPTTSETGSTNSLTQIPEETKTSNSLETDSICKGSIEELKRNCPHHIPDWLLEASIDEELVEITQEDSIIWHEGTWYGGTWKGDVWKNGEWKRRFFPLSLFYDDSVWEKGIWENGTWEDGTWCTRSLDTDDTCIWMSGLWLYGDWLDGEWQKGKWRWGDWMRGDWCTKGDAETCLWHFGTWNNGTWYDGTWKFGYWLGGTWLKGKRKPPFATTPPASD